MKAFFKQHLAAGSLLILLLIVMISALAPWLAPYDPLQSFTGLRLAPPGTPGHWLGGDNQGRDMLSRLIWGGRSALGASILPVIVAALLSLAFGMLAGYRDSAFSAFIMRITDMLFAFPMVLLAIGLSAVLGSGYLTVTITLICSVVPYLTRVVYSDTRAEVRKEYVEALHAQGASHSDILFRELLPNVATPLLVYTTSLLGGMVVFLAGLSFLGLGVQPPQADWGRMVGEGTQWMILGAPHIATLPACAIVVVSLAFNWLGDGLRDMLDPHRKGL
ncbi:ABC transporter permease [Pantoea sp. NPDC088449]|uniref:ABC transporter permease n=1 Tax=Pantoea sp. NPDC088449 TaxID=3364392 RepID=UPI00381A72F5